MSEHEGGSVPGGSESAAQAPEASAATETQSASATSAAPSASGDSGLAPGVAVDAAPPEIVQAQASASPTGEFVFGGRRFQTQKQAEDYFRSQIGRVPDLQRKTAEYERQMQELSSTVQALQRALSVAPTPAGTEQGQPGRVQAAQAGPKPFAERLVESGDLQFIQQLAEEKGLGHAIYALADLMGHEIQQVREQLRTEEIEPIVRAQEFRQIEGRALGVAKNLGSEFPEFDNSNQSPEAVEAQQTFVSTLKQFPPEFVAANPELAMLATALVTRYQHGVPVFAQQPGSSGSPSARAAIAAEQAVNPPSPLDESATKPNLRPPGAESPLDRIRRENQQAQTMVRSANGRPLFST